MKRLLFLLLFTGCASLPEGGPGSQVLGLAALAHCHEVGAVPYPNGVVGGEPVGLGDPDQHLVTLLKIHRADRDSVCTGTLISDRVILTAAHCVQGDPDVVAFFHSEDGCPLGQERELARFSKDIVIHPDFDGTPQSLADIALIKLGKPAPKEQMRVRPIGERDEPSSDSLTLIGFGITGETQADSQILRRVNKSYSRELSYKGRAIVVDQRAGTGFCRGDSGAPILAEMYLEPRVLGVNSANVGTAVNSECHTLSLSMDVRKFADWMRENDAKLESPSL